MSTQNSPSSEKLTWQTKLAFGAGDLGPAVVAAISGFFLNAILEATGYINHVPGEPVPIQPPAVLLALRAFVSLVPVITLLLSFIAVRAYPITREKHAEMRAQLAQRKAEV